MLTYTISIWHDEVRLVDRKNKDAHSVLEAFFSILHEQQLFTRLNKGVVYASIFNHSDPLNIKESNQPLKSYQIVVKNGNFETCKKVNNPKKVQK